jgi:hypothetical protein
MSTVAYTVAATFPDPAVRDRYIAWLEDGHVDAVIEAGASSAMIVRITDPADPPSVEVRYIFPNADVFDRYLRLHAPDLRAAGLRLFGPETGVRFSRSVGTIL